MSQDCPRCSALQAQVSQLQALVRQLNQRIEYLQQVLAELRGAVATVVKLIDRELQKPTMPRQRLVPAIVDRLRAALESVGR